MTSGTCPGCNVPTSDNRLCASCKEIRRTRRGRAESCGAVCCEAPIGGECGACGGMGKGFGYYAGKRGPIAK